MTYGQREDQYGGPEVVLRQYRFPGSVRSGEGRFAFPVREDPRYPYRTDSRRTLVFPEATNSGAPFYWDAETEAFLKDLQTAGILPIEARFVHQATAAGLGGLGAWYNNWHDLTKAVNTNLQIAGKTIEKAAQDAWHEVVHSTTVAGHEISVAFQKGEIAASKAAHEALHAASAEVHKLADKLKMSPYQKVVLYVTTVPAPAGIIMAYDVMKHHREEVISHLPQWARDGLTAVPAKIDQVMGLQGLGSVGLGSLSSWWHTLSGTQKALFITLTIALLAIVVICTLVSAGVLTWPAVAGAISVGTAVTPTFGGFVTAVGGWTAAITSFEAFMGPTIFNAPASIQTSIPPVTITTQPTAEEMAAMERDVKPPLSTAAKVAIPLVAASAAALLFLPH